MAASSIPIGIRFNALGRAVGFRQLREITVTSVTASSFSVTSFNPDSINTTNLTATNFSTVNFNPLSVSTAALTATNFNTDNFNPANINTTNLTATNLNTTNFNPASINTTNLTATNLNTTNFNPANINATNVTATNFTGNNATIQYVRVDTTGTFSRVETDSIVQTPRLYAGIIADYAGVNGNITLSANLIGAPDVRIQLPSFSGTQVSGFEGHYGSVTATNLSTINFNPASINTTNLTAVNFNTTNFNPQTINSTNVTGTTVSSLNFKTGGISLNPTGLDLTTNKIQNAGTIEGTSALLNNVSGYGQTRTNFLGNVSGAAGVSSIFPFVACTSSFVTSSNQIGINRSISIIDQLSTEHQFTFVNGILVNYTTL